MIVKPLSERARLILLSPLIVATAPAWIAVAALIWLSVTLARLRPKPRWRRVFALWPVECDPWPDSGFNGWVWLEWVWKRPSEMDGGWTYYRREDPAGRAALEQG